MGLTMGHGERKGDDGDGDDDGGDDDDGPKQEQESTNEAGSQNQPVANARFARSLIQNPTASFAEVSEKQSWGKTQKMTIADLLFRSLPLKHRE
ncbi:hypothetical protein HYQ46_000986 [Verticillium longisporum]|nr:hypothetical protein HYQ46_000986 [Verticillium longisporum]